MNKEKKIKALIIEDEEPARVLIRHFASSHESIEIVGECSDGFCGLKHINEFKPDLVFLDVQMPKLTGFELLEILEERPEIIFTTAFDEYAIKAFELNAVDYLLKPFSQERFDEAVGKAKVKIRSGEATRGEVGRIIDTEKHQGSELMRIVVRKGSSISFIAVTEVQYIEAEDDYVMIWHSGGKALKQQTMKYYAGSLPAHDFARIHRSYIARIEFIDKIEPYGKDTYRAILKNGKSLPVSRTGYRELRDKTGE